ncbi:MAG: FAD-dependent monooxygenase [Myxococcota bacterium]
MTTANAPVLVVGGRTTGLMMASELARRDIPVRIIDKSPGIDPHVRANLLHSRTLELFQSLGIAEAVIEGSFEEHGVCLYAQGELVAVERHAPVDSAFPYGMSQSQATTESVLEGHLNRLGVEVERSVVLREIEERGDRVVATLEHENGSTETTEAPWLIGCDGAHSAVRHLTGCAFPGDPDPYPYVLADVVVDGKLEDNFGYFFLHEAGDLFLFSMLPGRRRLVSANLPPGHELDESPTLEQMQALVDERGVPGLTLSDPRWLTTFRIHYRLAPHYRQGRIFLAGDAAHVHSLLAGQGMNTGIQDAYNLGWKLASVIDGIAPEAWLDTYESERKQVGAQVLAMTRHATENAELFANVSQAERDRLVAHTLIPEAQRVEAARSLQELDIDYRGSRLCVEADSGFEGGPRAGAQAPDASPILVDGVATSLFKQWSGTRYRLVLFGGHQQSMDEVRKVAAESVERYRDWIDAFVVVREPEEGWGDVVAIHDAEGVMHDRYAADMPCMYLVRPDGYVAYRDRNASSPKPYFDRVL